MKFCSLLGLLMFCTITAISQTENLADSLRTTPPPAPPTPSVQLIDYQLSMEQSADKQLLIFNAAQLSGRAQINLNNGTEDQELIFKNGKASIEFTVDDGGKLLLLKNSYLDEQKQEKNKYKLFHLSEKREGFRVKAIPLWLSIIPPLVAILLALFFKEVIVSLFIGIWAGAFIANGLQFGTIMYSILEVVEKYVIKALLNRGHLSVIVFSLMIGGMVAIISRNGGMAGVVKSLSKYARSPRSAQFITWLLGIAIFFDDYANTLIVGNTMRSVTDKFKISREKLAYIVDSTAAPVSAIAFITTWIGAELGYIEGGIGQLANFDTNISAYAIFISSLKYSFYPILTLIFILLLIYFNRSFGTMYQAEFRAATTGRVSPPQSKSEDEPDMEDLTPVKGAPLHWYNAAIPVLVVIFMTILGLMSTGMDASYETLATRNLPVVSNSWGDTWDALSLLNLKTDEAQLYYAETSRLSPAEVAQKQNLASRVAAVGFSQKLGLLIGNADSYVSLLWASLLGIIFAALLTISGHIMNLYDTMNTMVMGFKTMLPALIILTLAWSLALVTKELYTANYLTSILQGSVSPYAMPVIIFVLAGAIAFSTGSSWSTMAILYPIAIPTTWAICTAQGLDPAISMEILLNVIAVVLAASVLGDHCSPISDTTILSSLASDCNHIDHVRTQMPYALTVGLVSLVAGGVSTLLGGGLLVCLIVLALSVAILASIILKFGKKVPEAEWNKH